MPRALTKHITFYGKMEVRLFKYVESGSKKKVHGDWNMSNTLPEDKAVHTDRFFSLQDRENML